MAEIARQRASLELKYKDEIKTARENGKKDAWTNINVDTRLLKE